MATDLVSTGAASGTALAPPAPPRKLSLAGRQKAAALLVALGPERAATVLKHLGDHEIQQVAAEMANLPRVDADTSLALMDHAAEAFTAPEGVSLGGKDFASDVLERALGKSKATETLESLSADRRPFDFLRRTPPEQIVAFLGEESPQTIALVLASLHSVLAARVLAQLPGDKQSDVALRIATMRDANPEVIADLEEGLKRKLSSVLGAEATDAGGVDTVASILNHAGRSTERNVLQTISRTHADLAEEIRQRLFTFDDLVVLSDRDVQLVLREVDQKELALALRGTTESVREKLLANISSRGADMLREDMETMQPQPKQVVEEAQMRIVAAVRRLEDAGALTLARGEDDELL